eukprot:1025878-Rhodomonas_salina.6
MLKFRSMDVFTMFLAWMLVLVSLQHCACAPSPGPIRHPEDILVWFQCETPRLTAHQVPSLS